MSETTTNNRVKDETVTEQGIQETSNPNKIRLEVLKDGETSYVEIDPVVFQKEVDRQKAISEKVELSPARQQLEKQKQVRNGFLEAYNQIQQKNVSYLPEEEQQIEEYQTTGYEPIEIQQQITSLPNLPNLFQSQLPQMEETPE